MLNFNIKKLITFIIISIVLFSLLVTLIINIGHSDSDNGHIHIEKNSSDSESDESSESDISEIKTTKSTSSSEMTETTNVKKQDEKTTYSVSTHTEETTAENFIYPADINKASYECLCGVKNIGSYKSQLIIDYRNNVGIIHDISELKIINGIGESTINLLNEYFYVDESDKIISTTSSVTTISTTLIYTSSERTTVSENTSEDIVTEPPKVMKKVNINTASSYEIVESLLISEEIADDIVNFREKITYYSHPYELLYIDSITKEMLQKIIDYIEI